MVDWAVDQNPILRNTITEERLKRSILPNRNIKPVPNIEKIRTYGEFEMFTSFLLRSGVTYSISRRLFP